MQTSSDLSQYLAESLEKLHKQQAPTGRHAALDRITQ
jgi:hypothetical protein